MQKRTLISKIEHFIEECFVLFVLVLIVVNGFLFVKIWYIQSIVFPNFTFVCPGSVNSTLALFYVFWTIFATLRGMFYYFELNFFLSFFYLRIINKVITCALVVYIQRLGVFGLSDHVFVISINDVYLHSKLAILNSLCFFEVVN